MGRGDGTSRLLPLRPARPPLRGRAVESLDVPLPRLPTANRVAVQRRRLLSARTRRADGGLGQALRPAIGERLRRRLPLLPRMRIVALVGARAHAPSDRRRGGRLRRSRFPDARTDGVVRRPAPVAGASTRDRRARQKSGENRDERMTAADRLRAYLLPSRRREGSGVGSDGARAHPAAARQQAAKPRCPSRLREGTSNLPSDDRFPPQADKALFLRCPQAGSSMSSDGRSESFSG